MSLPDEPKQDMFLSIEEENTDERLLAEEAGPSDTRYDDSKLKRRHRDVLNLLKTYYTDDVDKAYQLVFLIRSVENLHKAFFITSLTRSLFIEMATILDLDENTLRIGVFDVEFVLCNGLYTYSTRVRWDYDTAMMVHTEYICQELGDGKIDVYEAMAKLDDLLAGGRFNSFDRIIRDFPGRLVLLPIMAATCAGVYFNGTWTDVAFGALAGLVTGVVTMVFETHKSFVTLNDVFIGFLAGVFAGGSAKAVDYHSCSESVVLGTLYWFFYGTAFTLALAEVMNGDVVAGVTRFFFAYFRSYILSFASQIGFACYRMTPEQLDTISDTCTNPQNPISFAWQCFLFVFCAFSCLGQFRMHYKHLLPSFLTQCATHFTQLSLNNISVFGVDYAIPALVSVITASFVLRIYAKLSVDNPFDMFKRIPEKQHKFSRLGVIPVEYTDVFVVLLPAIYLLVPGSKIFLEAWNGLRTVVSTTYSVDDGGGSTDSGSSLILIAVAIVTGLQLGFVGLKLLDNMGLRLMKIWHERRCCYCSLCGIDLTVHYDGCFPGHRSTQETSSKKQASL